MLTSENPCFARFGYVSDYNSGTHRARVTFPDMDNLVSNWLSVGVPNSKLNRDKIPLDINEHVLCIMTGKGVEEGVIVCSIYDDTNQSENLSQDIRYTRFSDGTEIFYDRENHLFHFSNQAGSFIEIKDGDISINAANHISINAPRIDLN